MLVKHGMTKRLGFSVVVVCTLISSGCIEGDSDTQGPPASVTQVDAGLGLTGGPITTTGTIDLNLSAAGGLSKTWGFGFDELGIIPGSMGARSYIVRGKGNLDSFHSCAHGAGRKMSRSAAKKRFKRKDMEQQTRGVECRKDSSVIDEIPAAYKDIDQVMANQTDLIEVVHELKQVLCVKG